MSFLAFLIAHKEAVGAALLGLFLAISHIVALLPESAQKAKVAGALVKAMEFVSYLAHVDSPTTMKAPGTTAVKPADEASK